MVDQNGRPAPRLAAIHEQSLLGLLPRHVIDPPLGADAVDPAYAKWCEATLREAKAFADALCERLERQCWELESIEDAGLSGRIRYLVAIAAYAAAVSEVSRTTQSFEGLLSFLRTAHRILERKRTRATYDLSNALGSMVIRSKTRAECLGTWIWLSLGDGGGETRRFEWVRSTLRFMDVYGSEIEREFLPAAMDLWETHSAERASDDDGEIEVTREAARWFAAWYLLQRKRPPTGPMRILAWDEIEGRRPCLYGFTEAQLSNTWVVYVGPTKSGPHPSEIILVDRAEGNVLYWGSANDEG